MMANHRKVVRGCRTVNRKPTRHARTRQRGVPPSVEVAELSRLKRAANSLCNSANCAPASLSQLRSWSSVLSPQTRHTMAAAVNTVVTLDRPPTDSYGDSLTISLSLASSPSLPLSVCSRFFSSSRPPRCPPPLANLSRGRLQALRPELGGSPPSCGVSEELRDMEEGRGLGRSEHSDRQRERQKQIRNSNLS